MCKKKDSSNQLPCQKLTVCVYLLHPYKVKITVLYYWPKSLHFSFSTIEPLFLPFAENFQTFVMSEVRCFEKTSMWSCNYGYNAHIHTRVDWYWQTTLTLTLPSSVFWLSNPNNILQSIFLGEELVYVNQHL